MTSSDPPWEVREAVYMLVAKAGAQLVSRNFAGATVSIDAAGSIARIARAPDPVFRWLESERAYVVLKASLMWGRAHASTTGIQWACDRAEQYAKRLRLVAIKAWPNDPTITTDTATITQGIEAGLSRPVAPERT